MFLSRKIITLKKFFVEFLLLTVFFFTYYFSVYLNLLSLKKNNNKTNIKTLLESLVVPMTKLKVLQINKTTVI